MPYIYANKNQVWAGKVPQIFTKSTNSRELENNTFMNQTNNNNYSGGQS